MDMGFKLWLENSQGVAKEPRLPSGSRRAVPPPVKYDLKDWEFGSDNKRINSRDRPVKEWMPLELEDLATTSKEDAVAWLAQHGKNNTKLGQQMTDEELHAFFGLPTARRTGRGR